MLLQLSRFKEAYAPTYATYESWIFSSILSTINTNRLHYHHLTIPVGAMPCHHISHLPSPISTSTARHDRTGHDRTGRDRTGPGLDWTGLDRTGPDWIDWTYSTWQDRTVTISGQVRSGHEPHDCTPTEIKAAARTPRAYLLLEPRTRLQTLSLILPYQQTIHALPYLTLPYLTDLTFPPSPHPPPAVF